MACIINIFDKDTSNISEINHILKLAITESHITVEDLIKRRVREEYLKYRNDDKARPLIKRSEKSLKNLTTTTEEVIAKLAEDALTAFQNNGFFIIFNDRQLESLRETVELRETNSVEFFKLVPLIGG
jgi:hypothetical protein